MPVLSNSLAGENTRIFSMHALSLTIDRERQVFEQTRDKLLGVTPIDRIQKGNIRAFFELSADQRTCEIKLNASDGNSVIASLEKLIPMNRVARVYGMSIGICQVPVVSGTRNFGNAIFTNDPESGIFSANEKKALRAVFSHFNKLTFNQTDRWDALATNTFQVLSADANTNQPKYIALPATYTVIGGEENKLIVTIPPVGDIAEIAGPSAGGSKNYLFVDFTAFYITAGEKDAIVNAFMK